MEKFTDETTNQGRDTFHNHHHQFSTRKFNVRNISIYRQFYQLLSLRFFGLPENFYYHHRWFVTRTSLKLKSGTGLSFTPYSGATKNQHLHFQPEFPLAVHFHLPSSFIPSPSICNHNLHLLKTFSTTIHSHNYQPTKSTGILTYWKNFQLPSIFTTIYPQNQPENSTGGTFSSTVNFHFSGWKSTVIDGKIYGWDNKSGPGHYPQPSPSIFNQKIQLAEHFHVPSILSTSIFQMNPNSH